MALPDEDYIVFREIIQALLESDEILTRQRINRIKNKVCAKYRRPRTPTNADILQVAIPEEYEILRPLLQKRPVRTVSGVAVVATMTEPHACPHGKCAYCPGGPDLPEPVPQSYTGHEPATMRGIQHNFDPYKQVESRLNQLKTIGHSIQKVELIVMGGDWCSKPTDYKENFVKNCLDAMNGSIGANFEETKKINETATVRNVGMTFETRPDQVTDENIDDMLRLGATRVEIGVQSLSDEILEHVQRGHDSNTTAVATKKLRDAGLKVCYHIMPGLPLSTPELDLQTFSTLFEDLRFKPDMLKIYPTIVVKHTKLYDWFKNGEYIPNTNEQIIELVSKAINRMPEYVRIQRIQRDIPLHQIEGGLSKGNLRELVHQWMNDRDLRNPTIRYREIGHYMMRTKQQLDLSEILLVRRDYEAADGAEIFLSFEDSENDIIFGFLRLRYPSVDAHRPEIREKPCVLIRELRVYGPVVEIGEKEPDAWQHFGLGEKMVCAAEDIARTELGVERILVNSGIGVKEYYRKLGFTDLGPYLAKSL
ncbi:MAG: tRNA uridine(34) 5-carboxymethylaminomethyl modification radical SAM/GNAT enzyme Elp3 [Candidatus Thorarchaeota archaeon]